MELLISEGCKTHVGRQRLKQKKLAVGYTENLTCCGSGNVGYFILKIQNWELGS